MENWFSPPWTQCMPGAGLVLCCTFCVLPGNNNNNNSSLNNNDGDNKKEAPWRWCHQGHTACIWFPAFFIIIIFVEWRPALKSLPLHLIRSHLRRPDWRDGEVCCASDNRPPYLSGGVWGGGGAVVAVVDRGGWGELFWQPDAVTMQGSFVLCLMVSWLYQEEILKVRTDSMREW